MAIRGPKPKPDTLRTIAGGKPQPTGAPSSIGPVEPPDTLTEPQLEAWDILVPPMDDLGILGESDVAALVQLCQLHVELAEANDEIAHSGSTVETPNGFMQQSAWVAIRTQTRKQYLALLTEFGATPSSRTRVRSTGGDGDKKGKAKKYLSK